MASFVDISISIGFFFSFLVLRTFATSPGGSSPGAASSSQGGIPPYKPSQDDDYKPTIARSVVDVMRSLPFSFFFLFCNLNFLLFFFLFFSLLLDRFAGPPR